GGDHEHEEHRRLAIDVAEPHGEGDERQVDGVEHQLDAHEHHERVPAHHQADRADAEQRRRQHEVVGGGGHHRRQHAHDSSPGSRLRLRVITTVPATATISSTDVNSNANTWSLNRLWASWRMFESPSASSAAPSPIMSRARTTEAMTRPVMPTPATIASGRWTRNGSTDRSSVSSTPSSMITNRNSTTIAPAYTITWTAARKCASSATKWTAMPNSV